MHSRMWTAAAALAGSLVLAGCGEGASSDAESPNEDEAGGGTQSENDGAQEDPVEGAVPAPEGSAADITAALVDAGGAEVGTVELTSTGDATGVRVTVRDLPPGFHGMHVHAEPACEPASTDPEDPSRSGDFLSAGGHLGAEESDHGSHAGDLPPLYVGAAGSGELLVETPEFSVDDIEARGGAALIIHSDRDNFAHVPERYAPDGPDEDTLSTGDAGARVACAVLTGDDS